VHEEGLNKADPVEQGPGVSIGRNVAVHLLRLAVATAILSYLFITIPAAQVFGVLRRAEFSWLLAAFLLTLLVQVVAAKRLKIIADAHSLGLTASHIFEINLVTRFYGLFLPGGSFTATAVRVFKLVRGSRHYAGAITAVTFDRLMATLMMCFVGIVFWMLAWKPDQLGWLLVMAAGFLSLAIPSVCLYLWPINLSKLDNTVARFLGGRPKSVTLAFSEVRNMPTRDLAWILIWSVLAHLLGIGEYVALAHSLDLDVSALALGWIRTAMLLPTLIPISLSGLGLREGAALIALPAHEVGPEAALAYSLLVFAVSNVAVGLVGGVLELSQFVIVRRI
jgi:uncharacterized protein (TIRG00374 family)